MGASFINRYKNYLRGATTLGGDDRLRGYPSNFFLGKDAVFYNIEFRSTSVEILKCALGGVVFYDAGDATQGFRMLHAKQSLGFGLRVLFPQLNRLVFRGDLAFPLKRGPFPETGIPTRVDPVGFAISVGQAFGP
jgi:hemolysin activation/secretion protein